MRVTAILSALSWLLLCGAIQTAVATAGDPGAELSSLQQELQELKQLLSMVLGAEPIEQLTGEVQRSSCWPAATEWQVNWGRCAAVSAAEWCY